MKTHFLFLTLFVGFSHSLFSQHTLTLRNNAPRAGDEIVKQQVEYKDPGRAGENVLWDFSKLKDINPEYAIRYFTPKLLDDTLYIMGKDTFHIAEINKEKIFSAVEHNALYHYKWNGSRLFLIGNENPTTYMQFRPPLLSSDFSLEFNREVSSPYASKGKYSGRVPLQSSGDMHMKYDAYGLMLLPSGDTLKHVVRFKSLQTIVEADSVRQNESDELLSMEMETYRWYAKGYRYPVFETLKVKTFRDDGESDYVAMAYFYPPQEHYYLEDDPENLAVLDSLQTEAPQLSWIERNFRYNVYPNPVVNTLYIDYYLEEAADVKVTLFNSVSMPVQLIPLKQREAGAYAETVDFTGLMQGSYVLRFDVKGEFVSEVILKR